MNTTVFNCLTDYKDTKNSFGVRKTYNLKAMNFYTTLVDLNQYRTSKVSGSVAER